MGSLYVGLHLNPLLCKIQNSSNIGTSHGFHVQVAVREQIGIQLRLVDHVNHTGQHRQCFGRLSVKNPVSWYIFS
jgi:hypothetical protein